MHDVTILIADNGMTTVDAFKHLAAPNFDHINRGCHRDIPFAIGNQLDRLKIRVSQPSGFLLP
ncbi:MAG: hypothetical protein ACJAXK_002373 [Yoonia sp.]|jgi:hypothetical protein